MSAIGRGCLHLGRPQALIECSFWQPEHVQVRVSFEGGCSAGVTAEGGCRFPPCQGPFSTKTYPYVVPIGACGGVGGAWGSLEEAAEARAWASEPNTGLSAVVRKAPHCGRFQSFMLVLEPCTQSGLVHIQKRFRGWWCVWLWRIATVALGVPCNISNIAFGAVPPRLLLCRLLRHYVQYILCMCIV